jgi:hypothetical protein
VSGSSLTGAAAGVSHGTKFVESPTNHPGPVQGPSGVATGGRFYVLSGYGLGEEGVFGNEVHLSCVALLC